jgi:hypothetical protein
MSILKNNFMHFKLIPIVCFSFVLLISRGNNFTAADNNNTIVVCSTSDKGNFIFNVDGKPVSIAAQKPFSEFRLDPYSKGTNDGIMLVDGNEKQAGFQFEIKKSGTTKIKNDASGDANCIMTYYDAKGNTFVGRDVVMVVTAYNGTHLTGTFSGKFKQLDLVHNANKTIQITDGKFDLHK